VRRAGTKVQPPARHACTGGQCATLTVPLDYSDPDGKTVKLAVFRIPTKDRCRLAKPAALPTIWRDFTCLSSLFERPQTEGENR